MPVVELLESGVRTVGNCDRTGIWKPANNRATCPVEAVWRGARNAQVEIQNSRKHIEVDRK
eukprot:1440567-Karenia_brevis.AAC.1